jgi:pyroglutamyl-peptidase
VEKTGIPAEVSQTAGTYVCNHTFDTLMRELPSRPGIRGGFVHVPFAPDQAEQRSGAPSLTVDSMAEAVAAVVRTLLSCLSDATQPSDLTRPADVALAAGSLP